MSHVERDGVVGQVRVGAGMRRDLSRRTLIMTALAGGVVVTAGAGGGTQDDDPARGHLPLVGSPVGAPPAQRVLNLVAHPDDDLLFLSPDLLNAVRAGAQVRTVYLTAGDAGREPEYWLARRSGVRQAYARMAGVADRWRMVDCGVAAVTSICLEQAPQVSLAFFGLPDGGSGNGFGRSHHSSLLQLWRGQQAEITAVDGTAGYTRAQLIAALTQLIDHARPQQLRTLDVWGAPGDGDHVDHHVSAYLGATAARVALGDGRLVAYLGYPVARRPANVQGPALQVKTSVFGAYAANDPQVCAGRPLCAGSRYGEWVARQYLVDPPGQVRSEAIQASISSTVRGSAADRFS
jgi:LmbE family N-acetylglucosaminyl deacetylase